MSEKQEHWIFGYGSLICRTSRTTTTQWLEDANVTLHGYERNWCANISAARTTVLGITQAEGATCNGMLVRLTEEALRLVDERERASVYARHALQRSRLDFPAPSRNSSLDNSWGYVCVTPKPPDTDAPIVQSYVDVVLGGCLATSTEFAQEFIRTTGGWRHPWLNDRAAPRYVRAVRNPKLETRVDELLKQTIPEAFAMRRE